MLRNYTAAGELKTAGTGGGGGGGGASAFIDLSDAPASYAGEGGKAVAVNVGETGLEFVDFPSGSGSGFTEHQFLPTFPRHDGGASWAVNSGSWSFSGSDTGHKYGGVWVSDGSNGSKTSKKFMVQTTGTYSARMLLTQHGGAGIATLDLDGTDKGSQDCYIGGGGAGYNFWSAEYSLGSLTAGTQYTVGVRANGRNGSASSYEVDLNEVHIFRTA